MQPVLIESVRFPRRVLTNVKLLRLLHTVRLMVAGLEWLKELKRKRRVEVK